MRGSRFTIRMAGILDFGFAELETRMKLSRFEGIPLRQGNRRQTVYVRLDELQYVDASSLLYIVAQVDRLSALGYQVLGNYPKRNPARWMFNEADFRGHMQGRAGVGVTGGNRLKITRKSSGDQLNPEDWLALHQFLATRGDITEDQQEALYQAFGECVENVRQHAFVGRAPGMWYAVAVSPHPSGPCQAAVVDLGVGVPGSVRKTNTDRVKDAYAEGLAFVARILGVEELGKLADRLRDDWTCLFLACHGKRTRTADEERGTGLSGLREVVSDPASVSTLRVMSGNASVAWARTAEPKPNRWPRLRGTIVCLELPPDARD